MKLLNIFKFLKGTGKKVNQSVKGTLEFMDDVLEKEYIVNTISDVKEASGKVVEKSGELYQRAKDKIDNIEEELEEGIEAIKDRFQGEEE